MSRVQRQMHWNKLILYFSYQTFQWWENASPSGWKFWRNKSLSSSSQMEQQSTEKYKWDFDESSRYVSCTVVIRSTARQSEVKDLHWRWMVQQNIHRDAQVGPKVGTGTDFLVFSKKPAQRRWGDGTTKYVWSKSGTGKFSGTDSKVLSSKPAENVISN